MTWGCTDSILGDGLRCLHCKRVAVCRSACRKLTPVACEEGYRPPAPEGGPRPPSYLARMQAVVLPGDRFTASELAGLLCESSRAMSSWCSRSEKCGILIAVGRQRVPGGRGNATTCKVYQYTGFVPSRDGMTGDQANGKGRPQTADRAASGRGEEE